MDFVLGSGTGYKAKGSSAEFEKFESVPSSSFFALSFDHLVTQLPGDLSDVGGYTNSPPTPSKVSASHATAAQASSSAIAKART